MVTNCSQGIYGYDALGNLAQRCDWYITQDSDLAGLGECVPGSVSLNIITKDVWILMDDFKWHKYGTTEVYGV